MLHYADYLLFTPDYTYLIYTFSTVSYSCIQPYESVMTFVILSYVVHLKASQMRENNFTKVTRLRMRMGKTLT